MDTVTRKKGEPAPFFEVKQRYCPHADCNVVMRRQIGTDGGFTCMSSHLCGESCDSKDENGGAQG